LVASILAVCAYSLSNAIYSFSCFAAVRLLRAGTGGVVVPIIESGAEGIGEAVGGGVRRSPRRSRRKAD
jgi:hypothetical protein